MEYYRDLMIGEEGQIVSFSKFMQRIADTGALFNREYLEAEYNHAHMSAIMASKWDSILGDYLEYSAVNDARTRPSHKKLHRFNAPKNHPIWNKIYPPNGWNCRCTVIPGYEQKVNKKITAEEAGKIMKPELKNTIFDNNVGKSRLIFKNNHPYFLKNGEKIQNLSWEQYGLKSTEKIQLQNLPHYKETTEEEYFAWWEKQKKKQGDDLVVNDRLNTEIVLPGHEGKSKSKFNYFKWHILRKSGEKRYLYATEVVNILKNPDEIWLNPMDKNTRTYIKYYDKGAIKLVVDENFNAISLYLTESKFTGSIEKSRKGILLYKK
ncbi:MAG: hypothetical protein FDW93_00705 [Bergeyella sp.]|nr:hypothetical protein [Bergeyella sp.]